MTLNTELAVLEDILSKRFYRHLCYFGPRSSTSTTRDLTFDNRLQALSNKDNTSTTSIMSLPIPKEDTRKEDVPLTPESFLQLGPPSSFDDISKAKCVSFPPTPTTSSTSAFLPPIQQPVNHLTAQQAPSNATAELPDQQDARQSTVQQTPEDINAPARVPWKSEDELRLIQIAENLPIRPSWTQTCDEFNDGRRSYRSVEALKHKYTGLCKRGENVSSTTPSASGFSPPSQQLDGQSTVQRISGDMTTASSACYWNPEDELRLTQLVEDNNLPYGEFSWNEIATKFNDSKRPYRSKVALSQKYLRLHQSGQNNASITPRTMDPYNSTIERS